MNRAAELSKAFVETQPASAARTLDLVPSADAAAFLVLLTEPQAADIIARMQPSRASAILESLSAAKAAALLHHGPAHVRAVLMRALPPPVQQTILKAVPRRQAAVLSRYLSYDPGTVGAWMDAPSVTLLPDTTVHDCLRELRNLGNRLNSSLFVTDGERRLLGTVELDVLLAAEDEEAVESIMRRDISSISPQATLASVVSLEAWDSLLALPVTDRGRLVGSLRFDSLREGLVIDQGATGGLQVNAVIMHMVQAFLISLSGLLQVATTEPVLSRLKNDPEQH